MTFTRITCALLLLMATSLLPSLAQTNSSTVAKDAIIPGAHSNETSPSGAEMDDPVARHKWMMQRYGGKPTEATPSAESLMIRASAPEVSFFEFGRHPERSCFSGGAKDLARAATAL